MNHFASWSIEQIAIAIVIILAIVALVVVFTRVAGVSIPDWMVKVFWIVIAAIVVIAAIRFVAGM